MKFVIFFIFLFIFYQCSERVDNPSDQMIELVCLKWIAEIEFTCDCVKSRLRLCGLEQQWKSGTNNVWATWIYLCEICSDCFKISWVWTISLFIEKTEGKINFWFWLRYCCCWFFTYSCDWDWCGSSQSSVDDVWICNTELKHCQKKKQYVLNKWIKTKNFVVIPKRKEFLRKILQRWQLLGLLGDCIVHERCIPTRVHNQQESNCFVCFLLTFVLWLCFTWSMFKNPMFDPVQESFPNGRVCPLFVLVLID